MPDTTICHRCARVLRRGHAEFFIVTIEAVADPEIADPGLTPAQLEAEYESLIEQMRHMSERELMDDVHRRLALTLCNACYKAWIENPTP